MFTFRFCSIIILLFASFASSAQTDFRAGYEKENPAPPSSGLSNAERLAAHQSFLREAEAKQDTLLRIYGELYILFDYIRLQDYPTATEHLLVAESLAAAAGNVGWQGGVAFRRGQLWVNMRETDEAIRASEKAAAWCAAAGDSLCVGESLEQISSMYGKLDSFSLARSYFDRALPLLKKYGAKKHLQTANSNYGILLLQEGKPAEAIPYLENAISLAEALNLSRDKGKAMNNLAEAHRLSGDVERAIREFNAAIAFNRKNGAPDNLLSNYAGLRESYEQLGDYRSAFAYQDTFRHFRDSLIGSKTKLQIARLEENFRAAEQQMKLESSEKDLLRSQQKLERIFFVLGVIFLATLVAVWFWRRQIKENEAYMAESRSNLLVLTRLLADKNTALLDLKAENKVIAAQSSIEAAGEEDADDATEDIRLANLYDQTILTLSDWSDFKSHFERAHPGYLLRLRAEYPTLTEAEERLFLLLKLNLNGKEIAAILGISSAGVKKTRNRLRKRLELAPEDDLEQVVLEF